MGNMDSRSWGSFDRVSDFFCGLLTVTQSASVSCARILFSYSFKPLSFDETKHTLVQVVMPCAEDFLLRHRVQRVYVLCTSAISGSDLAHTLLYRPETL